MMNNQTSNAMAMDYARLCTINICGLSQRSNMMLSKFVQDSRITIIGIQETGSNKQWKHLNNMKTFEDTNNQYNKGCAIMVRNGVMFTQLPDISKLSQHIDSVWGLVVLNGAKFIVGNVYLKLDHIAGVTDFLKMLNMAHDAYIQHRCRGVIVMGDFNARHSIWNDTTINKYGKHLEDHLDWSKFCIQAPSSATFLAKNGCSNIDFFITSVNVDRLIRHTSTDPFVNLYSGAPTRGHVPVIMDISANPHTRVVPTKKFDLNSMDWATWAWDIEMALRPSIVDNLTGDDDLDNLWEVISQAISTATKDNCDVKVVCTHSKPYWTDELTMLAGKLKDDLKAYLTRNTDDLFQAYKSSKDEFERARKLACQTFIMQKNR